MIKFICISGENRSGKDCLANMICEKLSRRNMLWGKYSFAEPVKESLRTLYSHKFIVNGVDLLNSDIKDNVHINIVTGELYIEKEVPINNDVKTIRELLIYYAETCVKLNLGNGIFANCILDRCYEEDTEQTKICILTDMRFMKEYEKLFSDKFNGCEKHLVRVTKDGGVKSVPTEFKFDTDRVFYNIYDKDSIEYEQSVDKILDSVI